MSQECRKIMIICQPIFWARGRPFRDQKAGRNKLPQVALEGPADDSLAQPLKFLDGQAPRFQHMPNRPPLPFIDVMLPCHHAGLEALHFDRL